MTTQPTSVLVSDFDGTMTRQDFFKLVISELLPPGTPDYWAMYRTGTITHFEALRRYFASIRIRGGSAGGRRTNGYRSQSP